ncbi:MAG: hypothetical protein H7A25_05180 [Leptospiraceae bacterium]|nr:hypothetical protein [Leptospiraceae bacterium]MCP5499272.1 hypothetical protein [Leptospiraceae bacterium]
MLIKIILFFLVFYFGLKLLGRYLLKKLNANFYVHTSSGEERNPFSETHRPGEIDVTDKGRVIKE